ncbi:MAG: class I SAM-dependent methyltransferase [Acidimicrobiia bacterium]
MGIRERLQSRQSPPPEPEPRDAVAVPRVAGLHVPDDVLAAIGAAIDAVPIDYGGGSSITKALVVADLVLEHGLETYVEIGVYKGRSLLPIGALFAALGRGTAFGIDPYSLAEAMQDDLDHFPEETAKAVNDFVRSQDWDAMHDGVVDLIGTLGCGDHCEIVRSTSADAVARFADASIGVLHIDGNHDTDSVRADVDAYRPKLSAGAFVVLDDASWPSVRPVHADLCEAGERVFELLDLPRMNDFAVFRLP